MATTISRPSPVSGRTRNGNSDTALRLHPASRRRSLPWVTVGVIIVVGAALTFAVTATHLGSRQPVLAVARAVPAGGVIGPGDVRVVHLSADAALHPLAARSLSRIVGRTAAVPLAPGTLLTGTELGPAAGIGVGKAAVGVALKSGQYPPDLAAGQTVRIVDVGISAPAGASTGTGAPTGQTAVAAATVTSVAPASMTSNGAVVGLVVPDTNADQVAALAAADRLALVEIPPQP